MRSQEQALKAYYASMSDTELLAAANNRESFIRAAQKAMDEELFRRQLTPTDDFRVETRDPSSPSADSVRPPVISPLTHSAGVGATEDQVSMAGTMPERVNKHGDKIEDIAGTGQHDSPGG